MYLCRSLSNLRLMSALWGEMKVTVRIPHAGKHPINSAISQHVKPCHALLPSIDVCSVSGPPRFVTLIACQGRKTESNWTPWCYAGRGGKEGISKRAAGIAWIDGRQTTEVSTDRQQWEYVGKKEAGLQPAGVQDKEIQYHPLCSSWI